MILEDRIIKGSFDFIHESASWSFTTLPSLVAIYMMEIRFYCFKCKILHARFLSSLLFCVKCIACHALTRKSRLIFLHKHFSLCLLKQEAGGDFSICVLNILSEVNFGCHKLFEKGDIIFSL